MTTHEIDRQRIVKDLADWIARPQNYDLLVRQSISDIRGHLENLQPSLSLCLGYIATWEAVFGERQLFEGDMEGWTAIQRSYQYSCWSKRIRLAFLDAGRGQKNAYISEFALLLAHAIVLRDDVFAAFLGTRLVEALVAGDKRFLGWDVTPFEPFMVKVYSRWRGVSLESVPVKTATSDIYERIMQTWSDSESLSQALVHACEYHITRSDDTNNPDFPEFVKAPYSYFPVEILAIQRIRFEQGLLPCSVDHPIMHTPLASVPESIPIVKDELLDKVIEKVRRELSIGNPW